MFVASHVTIRCLIGLINNAWKNRHCTGESTYRYAPTDVEEQEECHSQPQTDRPTDHAAHWLLASPETYVEGVTN